MKQALLNSQITIVITSFPMNCVTKGFLHGAELSSTVQYWTFDGKQ
jgi:hypothetical protein